MRESLGKNMQTSSLHEIPILFTIENILFNKLREERKCLILQKDTN